MARFVIVVVFGPERADRNQPVGPGIGQFHEQACAGDAGNAALERGANPVGEEYVINGAKTGTDIPKNIVTDGPVVTKANADGMLWMEDQFLI